MGSWAHTELIDLVLAVTFNLVFGPLSDSVELIPQTMRPNPGQLLQLEFNGTKVIFVRDPANDHAKVAETVPAWALVVMMMLVFCLLVGLSFLPRAPGGKFPAPTMFLWAVGVTIVITDSVKHYVGRLRPNWYSGCGWSEALLRCTVDFADGRNSFPSGHSSESMVTCLLLTLYLRLLVDTHYSEAARSSPRGSPALVRRILASFACAPVLVAIFIASSRVHDNWHFPSDVVTGATLGASVAVFYFKLYFPDAPRHAADVYASPGGGLATQDATAASAAQECGCCGTRSTSPVPLV